MFNWPRPPNRTLTIAAWLGEDDESGGVVYEGNYPMATYNLRLIHVTTKAGGAAFSSGDNSWSGIDQAALASMLAMATKVEAAVKKAANQGGPLGTVLTCQVSSPDGGAIPPGANSGPTTYTGITFHGISDVEDAMHQVGADLKKMGRDHANKKQGPKKGP